jgi:iron(III) transport system ATP-binding protein
MSALLALTGIHCRYGSTDVFRALSLQIGEGSIACLLGPSGCGKTTALRAIAGFEDVQAGSIMLDGRVLSEPGRTLPPEQRQVGMVFQDYALFPHLTVAQNIAFGLQGLGRQEQQQRSHSLLALIRMEQYAEAWPHQLSGGQQQRVALARALAPRPKLLLLDEPFSNLDTELRRALSLEVRQILKQHGTTAILVTHDQSEAFTVADEIGVMDRGQLLQWDTPQALYHRPATPFVATFVSQGQFIPGVLRSALQLDTVFGLVTLEPEALAGDSEFQVGSTVDLLLRPWNLQLAPASPCRARITAQQFNGAFTQTTLQLPDGLNLHSQDAAFADLPIGTDVGLGLLPRHLRLFSRP